MLKVKVSLFDKVKYGVKHVSSLAAVSGRRFKVLDGKVSIPESQKKSYAETFIKHEKVYHEKMTQVMAGGGTSSIIRHTKRNKKILARDRIDMLVDKDYPVLEISPFAGLGMEYGDICCAGNISVIAKVSGQLCIIGANDATVKGGTIYPIGVKKQLRMQEIAEENNLPCLYLMDSGGGFLPLQSEVFPGKDHGGKVFYNEAVMNSQGIPQICVVAGSCTAGAAYIPAMANEVIMVDKIGTIFLAGPPLVYAAIGEKITDQDLGGASVHCDVSGCADYKVKDEHEAIEVTKNVMSTLNMEKYVDDFDGHVEEPFFDQDDMPLLSLHRDPEGKLDVRKILARVLDASRFHEYKPTFGKEILTGFGRLNGFLVGVVANNGEFTKRACLKTTNFVSLCNSRGIPILFFQDILKSSNAHDTDLIKYQAEMMSAVATSTVPKITVIMGNSFGVGNYSMCGRSMSPRFLYTWPTAKVSFDDVDTMKIHAEHYGNNIDVETSSYFGSARIWDDGVIFPQDTRHVLSLSLNACLTHKNVEKASPQNVLRL